MAAQDAQPKDNQESDDNDAVFSDKRKAEVLLKDSRFADSLLVRSARTVINLIKKTTGVLLSSTADEQQAASQEKDTKKSRRWF